MKKLFYIALMAPAALFVASCAKDKASAPAGGEKHNVVSISVSATKEAAPESKVAYDLSANAYSFEADDKLQLLVGKVNSAGNGVDYLNVLLDQNPSKPGNFRGEIDLGDFTMDDVRGAVVVKSLTDTYKIGYSSGARIFLEMDEDQTYAADGQLTGLHFPFYTYIADSAKTYDEETGAWHIDDLTLINPVAVWEYHIYGSGAAGEKIRSIRIDSSEKTVAALMRRNLNTSNNQASYNGHGNYSVVTVTAPLTVGATRDEGAVVYNAIYARGASAPLALTKITVKTDAGEYVRTLSGVTKPRVAGHVYPMYINISGSEFLRTSAREYSIDDGATWSVYLPETTSATSLKVRTTGVDLTASDLSDIDSFIRSQSSTVALDMSGAVYESATLPLVFGSTTPANANKKLGNVVFPSNITTIAASAFRGCTGMTKLSIPNTVTNIGNYAFSDCFGLTDVYFNAVFPQAVNTGDSSRQRTFQNTQDHTKSAEPLVVKFGPDATFGAVRMFQFNLNIEKIVIEGSLYMGWGSFGGAANLKTVEIKGPAKAGSATLTYSNPGTAGAVPTGGTIYIPQDADAADYRAVAPWKQLTESYGWTIVNSTEW